jgi:hypothetical protein
MAGCLVTPRIIAALPGDGWVVECVGDNERRVLPLAGWGVREDGEVVTLPLSLGSEWVCRPMIEGDATLIRRSTARMVQRPVTGPFGATMTPWIDDAT